MLAFILSKMNLLIMVTAVFAIVAYFTFFFGRSVELRESEALLSRFVEDSYSTVTSSGLCQQTIVRIPPFIRSIGTGETNNQLRFLLKISVLPQSPPSKNLVIYSIIKKKDSSIIASKQFATDSDVRLFEWNPENGILTPTVVGSNSIFSIEMNPVAAVCGATGCSAGNYIDPESRRSVSLETGVPMDTVLLIKEVYNGKSTLVIIPCSRESGWCSANYQRALCSIKGTRDSSLSSLCSACGEPCLAAPGFNCYWGV